jgi:DNA-binding MarR family transcriptional regulator
MACILLHERACRDAAATKIRDENPRYRKRLITMEALKSEVSPARAGRFAGVRPAYLEALTLVERLRELTAGELRTRGYYLGSNVSYNVKKLVETGYLHHARSRIDRRAVRISLTDKGRDIHDIVSALYDKHVATVEQIGGGGSEEFSRLNQSLVRLERFWTDQIRYRL